MDLKNLKYFVAVYEKESFSGAAKHCFVAQPSISSAIAHLEAELNTPLFTRHARGVSANQQANKLYPLAKKLLGQAEAIKSLVSIPADRQNYSLGVTRGLGVKRMSALLKQFTHQAPSMELTLVPPLQNCDARIVTKEELMEGEQFINLWQEQYLLALPLNNRLATLNEIKLADLDGIPFIQRTPCSAWNTLSDTLTLAGINLDIRAKIRTIDYALGLVSAGLGCALVPAHPEVLEHSDMTFKSIEGLSLNREVILAYSTPSRLTATLIDVAKGHA